MKVKALTTAHSHAFQRGMRGSAQRPGPSGSDDFWSWRTSMYQLAERLTPESIYDISLVAFRELYQNGVGTVGEFHYVHHQPDGTPYDDRTLLSEAVIRAALDAKLRVALLRVIYHRAGPDRPPEGAQRRFSDPSLDRALADIDTLRSRYQSNPNVVIGVAPHSVRAVPPAWLSEIAQYAAQHQMPVHMHVAEQRAEIETCLKESGLRPVELLADKGLLSERFVAVHATHLAPNEIALMGSSRSFVCLCPTTERDLGDGLPNFSELRNSGVRFCVGVDSHVLTQPLEDLRCVDLGERLRMEKRVILRPDPSLNGSATEHQREKPKTPAEELWEIGSTLGDAACGFSSSAGELQVRLDDPSLALVPEELLLDAIVYSGAPSVLSQRR
jgi:formimidoylglutamate deiminase